MQIFIKTFKNSLVYRWELIFSILGSILLIAINIVLWSVLYSGDEKMIYYMIHYTIISNLIKMFYTKEITTVISDKVRDGSFVMDLIKPKNVFFLTWQSELGKLCNRLLFNGLPVILIFIGYLDMKTDITNLFLAIVAIALGHILYFLIYSIIGFLAFFFYEVWPFWRLMDDTIRLLSGAFIPLAILPSPLRRVADIFPFKFLFSFPLELLLNDLNSVKTIYNFAVLSAWIGILAVMSTVIYKASLKSLVVQGG